MKFIAKVAAVALVSGAAATLYGASGGYLEEAAAIKAKMVEDHRYVLQLKAQAVKDKDIIRLNCINDKLVVMLPQMNIADALISRVDDSDDAEQGEVYKDLQLAANNVREQREAASGCADVKLIVTESSNTFTEPPDLDHPVDPLPEPGEYIEPPGYASPDR